MSELETYLGDVQDVTGTRVSVAMSSDSLNGLIYIDGQGYRANQIGSFVRIPIGFQNLFGIISQVGASAAPVVAEDAVANSRWMTVQLIGEGAKNGVFQRGLSQYPTIGDAVHLISEKELEGIYGQPDRPYFVNLGYISNADSIPALVDINKLITRHSAVVGATGSGKSTTVASIVNALSNAESYPSARILMLDLHGEYGRALRDRATAFRIDGGTENSANTEELALPFWALNFDELCEVCFGDFNSEKDRNLVMERVLKFKQRSLAATPRAGSTAEMLSVDSPVPFSIHHLWYELYTETFGTHYRDRDGEPRDNLAYEVDEEGNELRGNPEAGIAPSFKAIATQAGAEKINYLPNSPNIGKQLLLLGSKLRIPRYNFLFNPTRFRPNEDGTVEFDLDRLLMSWVGSDKPVTILDLSGVPIDILQTIIGALMRLIYEAMFWARNLSQGARNRPLLVIMEEAHIYLNSASSGMASRMVQRIVKEGRKYGIGSMIVSQRPSEIDPTILSQCGTLFALRLSNGTDRAQITSAVSDNLDGLTDMLPILRTGEAIILGEAVKLPMRTTVQPPPKNRRPDSEDPVVFDEAPEDVSTVPGGWGIPMEPTPNYEELVEAWRAQNPRISRVK